MYLRVNQPFGLVYDHYLRPTEPEGFCGPLFTSTTQPKVGLCVLYLRPGPLRGQATLKENSTTLRVVTTTFKRN